MRLCCQVNQTVDFVPLEAYFETVEITDIDFVESLKREHEKVVAEKVSEIKSRILSIPNYLLILKNVLDRRWKDLDEVSLATDKIIHI